MRPQGSDALAGEEESGKKRLPNDANETPPKKRNKVHKDEGEGVNGQNAELDSKGTKVEDDNEDESVEGGAQVVAEARLARGQGRSTVTANWVELPTALLGRAFEWLSFTEGQHFFACNSVLWRKKRVEYESQMLHEIVLPGTPPCSFLGTLANVVRLDFGPYCNDEHLKYMRDEQVLPKLKHLGMARSLQVTDAGLAFLTENPTRCRTLESLDIAFCRRPTYGTAFLLRDRLKALVLIRRQPKWMDGKTVFASGEYETCWPDGSYATVRASGEMLDCGYYCDLFEHDSENRVTCKQQIVHSLMFGRGDWPSVPEWMRYAYRLARTYLHCPNDGTVVDAILYKGTFPVYGFPRQEHASTIRIGRQATFNLQGERCSRNDPNKCVTVVHRGSVPLDERMPPQEVVEKFQAHLKDMKRVMAGRDQERDERELHIATGGRESNEPPPQWFQYYS